MVARPGFGREAEAYSGSGVDVIELPFGEAWLRDSGPVFARRDGTLVAVDFQFNGWGTTLPASAHGETIGVQLAQWLGFDRRRVPLVLEGGAFTTDGAGTLIAVESTILDEGRNPGVSLEACEDAFRTFLGVERTIWLENGLLEDRTGGHVDNVAAFIGPGRVLCQTVTDRDDPNYARLAANRAILEGAVDAKGRRLELVELDVLPYREWAGRRIAQPYLNFYIGNVDPVYQPETITAYTLGSKNRFFDNRLQLNGEGFYWLYKDQQVSFITQDSQGAIVLATQNVGRATIKGMEVSSELAATANTVLSAHIQYLDATYSRFVYSLPNLGGPPTTGCPYTPNGASFLINCNGNTAPESPRWSLSLSAQQTFPFAWGDLVVSGQTLLDVAADDYGREETREEARGLMRALIAQRLHGQELHTRAVLKDLNEL